MSLLPSGGRLMRMIAALLVFSLISYGTLFYIAGLPFLENKKNDHDFSSRRNSNRVEKKNDTHHSAGALLKKKPISVCLVGRIPLSSMKENTRKFALARMVFLRDAALGSFRRGYSAACDDNTNANVVIKSFQISVPISGWEPHFSSWSEVQQFLKLEPNDTLTTSSSCNKTIKIQLWLDPSNHTKSAQNVLSNKNCDWVSVTRLDADDILSPGYLDFLVQDVIGNQLMAADHDEDDWLGALVASRHLPGVTWVDGRCRAIPGQYDAHHGFQGGSSQGQTRIFRGDVHKALNYPLDGGNHVYELGMLRTLVARKVLNLNYTTPFKTHMYDATVNAKDEIVTRIKSVETTLAGFGSAAAYMKTPLSGSLEWKDTLQMPPCTLTEWNNATSAFRPNTLDFLYNSTTLKVLEGLSVLDVCQSNFKFLKHNTGRYKRNWGDAKTCQQFETEWQQMKKEATTNHHESNNQVQVEEESPKIVAPAAQNNSHQANDKAGIISSSHEHRFSVDGYFPYSTNDVPSWIEEYVLFHNDNVIMDPDTNKTRLVDGARFIVFTCGPDALCGGVGDRTNGMVTLFYSAILSRRVLIIDHPHPFPLQSVLSPNRINWNVDEYPTPDKTYSAVDSLRRDGKPRRDFIPSILTDPCHADVDLQGIVLRVNQPYMKTFLWQGDCMKDLWQAHNITTSSYPSYTKHFLFRWAFWTMFRFSPEVLDQANRLGQESGLSKNGSTFRPYIAVHMRATEGRHVGEDVYRQFLTCAQRVQNATIKAQSGVVSGNDVKESFVARDIFLVSDNVTAKGLFQTWGGNETIKISNSIEPYHTDKNTQVKDAHMANLNVFAELAILMNSECLVRSRSGFSELAQMVVFSNEETYERCGVQFFHCTSREVEKAVQTLYWSRASNFSSAAGAPSSTTWSSWVTMYE